MKQGHVSEIVTAREWLRANGYADVAALIDEVMKEWQTQGKKTRRNWWEVLAGRKDGSPCIYAGRTFPILRAARRRYGLPDVAHAIERKKDEVTPPIATTLRWPVRRSARRRK